MSARYQVYNLRETYHELGRYEFKVVLSPRNFKNAHGFRVEMHDSDRHPMSHDSEVWGRKINVRFEINGRTADGVSRVNVYTPKGDLLCQLNYWVVKP